TMGGPSLTGRVQRSPFCLLPLHWTVTDAATEVEGDGGTDVARRVRRAVREVVLRTQRWAGWTARRRQDWAADTACEGTCSARAASSARSALRAFRAVAAGAPDRIQEQRLGLEMTRSG